MKPILKRGLILAGILLAAFILLNVYVGWKDAQSNALIREQEVKEAEETRKSGGYVKPKPTGTTLPTSAARLQAAEAAFLTGFTVEDPQGDWYQFPEGAVASDGRPDNPRPYPLEWTDLRSVSVGADTENLYLRYRLWGQIPTGKAGYGGDTVTGTGFKLDGEYTKPDGSKERLALDDAVLWMSEDGKPSETPRLSHCAWYGKVFSDKDGDDAFGSMNIDGWISGGPGSDYISASYSLQALGLAPGSEIRFRAGTESGSMKYHHECVDNLLAAPEDKEGSTLIYRVGEAGYTEKPVEKVVDPHKIPVTGVTKPFTAETLAKAEAALAAGVTIEDPEADWFQFGEVSLQPDGRADNPKPYPLPFTDLRSLSLGADAEWLYVKYRFWGPVPATMPIYGDDKIYGFGYKLGFTYTNAEGQPDDAETVDSLTWYQEGQGLFKEPVFQHSAQLSAKGEDALHETIYTSSSIDGYIGGGAGHDYMIVSYSLKALRLNPGSEVTFSCSTETSSATYHHECLDPLLGPPEEKGGARIRYTLGGSTYRILEWDGK